MRNARSLPTPSKPVSHLSQLHGQEYKESAPSSINDKAHDKGSVFYHLPIHRSSNILLNSWLAAVFKMSSYHAETMLIKWRSISRMLPTDRVTLPQRGLHVANLITLLQRFQMEAPIISIPLTRHSEIRGRQYWNGHA